MKRTKMKTKKRNRQSSKASELASKTSKRSSNGNLRIPETEMTNSQSYFLVDASERTSHRNPIGSMSTKSAMTHIGLKHILNISASVADLLGCRTASKLRTSSSIGGMRKGLSKWGYGLLQLED